jgi:hypothetical protein
VTPINIAMLELLSQAKCAEFRAKKWPNTPLAVYWGVDFVVEKTTVSLMPHWASRGLTNEALMRAAMTYLNVIDEVQFIVRRI